MTDTVSKNIELGAGAVPLVAVLFCVYYRT